MTPPPEGRAARARDLLERYGGLAVTLVVALPLRVSGLQTWWLNPDEGIYYSILSRATAGGFWSEVVGNAHPPLYYLLLRALGFVTRDFLWFRLFSVACGLAAVYGFWLMGRELGGRGWRGIAAGMSAALVVALAPGAVELSQVMRPYTLQLALLVGSAWLLLHHSRTGSRRALGGYLGLLCLALLTHYASVLALAAFAGVVAHEGVRGGWRRPGWRRLALLHAVPALVVAALYVWHLRPLMASRLADEALDGWLSFYMVGSPREAWLAFVGFHSLLAGPRLQGPLALLLLAGLGLSAARGDRRPAALGASGLLVALAAAVAGVYPLGSTRHAAWLMTFTVPVVAWLAGTLVCLPRRRLVAALAAVAVLLVAGDPVGRWMGRSEAPWAPTERVLRWDDLAAMIDVLDPDGRPRIVLMSSQTFYTLLPLYPREREAAAWAPDSTLFRFRLGERQVVAAEAWTFTAAPRPGQRTGDLPGALLEAEDAFPEVDFQQDPLALLLVAGWRLPLLATLTELSTTEDFIVARRDVPGLTAVILDVPAYRRAADRRP